MHLYTIVAEHRDLHLTTDIHHDDHHTIEEWIKAHKETIDTALKVGNLVVQVINVYVGHNRSGKKLK
jgi:imidazoleglycerol phosphate dehydratase HisB